MKWSFEGQKWSFEGQVFTFDIRQFEQQPNETKKSKVKTWPNLQAYSYGSSRIAANAKTLQTIPRRMVMRR